MNNKESFRPFLKYLRPHSASLAFALITSLIVGCLSVAYPLILQKLLDSWTSLTGHLLCQIISIFITVIVLQLLLSIAGNFVFVKATQKALASVRYSIYEKLMHKPILYFSNEKEGGIVSVFTNDVNTVNGMLTSGILSIFTNTFKFIAIISVLFYLEWRMSLVLVGLMVVYVCIYCLFGPRIKKRSRIYYDKLADITNMLHEACTGIRILKAFGYESGYGKLFKKELSDTAKTYEHLNLNGIVMTELCGLVSSFGLVCSIFFIGAVLSPEAFTLGTAVAYFSLISSSFNPLKSIMGVGVQYRTALGAADRINELFAEPDANYNHEAKLISKDRKIESQVLRFERVSFSYGDKCILRAASFAFNKGDRVLITGSSGAGKSTLVDIALRFSDPDEGSVFFHGITANSMMPDEIRKRISLVQQDPFLFNDTLRGNLLIADSNASDSDMLLALDMVGLGDFVASLPESLDTQVGERGAKFSGGEKQRISIARAILKNGDVIIFDESTAWLDPVSERQLWERLSNWLDARLSILICHNEATSFPYNRKMDLAFGKLSEIK